MIVASIASESRCRCRCHRTHCVPLIRPKLRPQEPQWPKIFDDAVFQSPVWRNVEQVAEFWKLYQKKQMQAPQTLVGNHRARR